MSLCVQATLVHVCVRELKENCKRTVRENFHRSCQLSSVAFEVMECPTSLHSLPGLVSTLGSVLRAWFVQAPLAKTQFSLHSLVTLNELDVKVESPGAAL